MDSSRKPANIDEYIAAYPSDAQRQLQAMRQIIHQAAPDAQETISYGMPAFRTKRILVYFGAHKGFIGFYPTAEGVEAFKEQLSAYEGTKGAVHFPLDQPIPRDLVTEIVQHRLEQVSKKA